MGCAVIRVERFKRANAVSDMAVHRDRRGSPASSDRPRALIALKALVACHEVSSHAFERLTRGNNCLAASSETNYLGAGPA